MRWLVATVAETVPETVTAITLRLDVEQWPGHRAGQHVDVRLTAEDGYQAQRSYSIASAPEAEKLDLTIVRIDDGEVSPYLTTVAEVGDQLELRGPIGGYFVWNPEDGHPVLLVGGGSGVVPLMAMLRQHTALGQDVSMRLVYSARTQRDILYRDELACLPEKDTVTITLTREPESSSWTGRRGRVSEDVLMTAKGERCFVCGPTPFVEAVADQLVSLGTPPADIKTERFGPTGG